MKYPDRLAIARAVLGAAVLTSLLAGCDTLNSVLATDKVDYKSAGTAPGLAVPPDLSTHQPNPAFVVPPTPGASGTVVTRQPTPAGNLTLGVPNATDPLGMHVERDGVTYTLVVDGRTPEQLWPQLTTFWEKNGFVLETDQPAAGILETDWAENRAKIPNDWFRNTFGKLVDNLYSSGTKDKFRMLVEQGAHGTTDITITHRAMEEMLIGRYGDTSKWVDRPRNPLLEHALLEKLMQQFGLTADQAQQLSATAQPATARAVPVAGADDPTAVRLAENIERAWPRVGLALDRSHFVVDQRDQEKGLYYVRFADTQASIRHEGFLGKLFTSGKPVVGAQYRVSVEPVDDASTRVRVVDVQGRVDTSAEAQRIIAALQAQLR